MVCAFEQAGLGECVARCEICACDSLSSDCGEISDAARSKFSSWKRITTTFAFNPLPLCVSLFFGFDPLFLFAAELHRILSQDRHPSYSAEFYSAYINILLGVFYSVCRDLRELRHLVRRSLASPQRLLGFFLTSICLTDFSLSSTRLPSTFQSSVSRCQKEKVKNKDVGFFCSTDS